MPFDGCCYSLLRTVARSSHSASLNLRPPTTFEFVVTLQLISNSVPSTGAHLFSSVFSSLFCSSLNTGMPLFFFQIPARFPHDLHFFVFFFFTIFNSLSNILICFDFAALTSVAKCHFIASSFASQICLLFNSLHSQTATECRRLSFF